MFTWKTAPVYLLAALFLMAAPASVMAKNKWAQKLGLSAAQQEQIKQIRYHSMRQVIQLKAKLQLARLDLSQLLSQHKPDQTALEAAIDKAGKLRLSMKKLRILQRIKMQAVLSASQFSQWKQMKAKRRRNRRMRRMRRMRRLRRMRGKF